MSKTFLITGVSTGLGRAIATEALHAGHTVVGTLRDPEQIKDFESLAPGRAHGRVMDVTDHDQVTTVVEEVTEAVAPIDVLVNNAGYGVEGTLEEASLADARAQFDVNVFGVIAVTKAVLPSMRERRTGHVFFITSMGGLRAFAGLSLYHGSKYAVEGIADSAAGGRALRHPRHQRRAGIVPHRLGGPFHATRRAQHPRLRRGLRPHP